MVGERAGFLVAGLAGDAMADDQGMPRPRTPLSWLIGPAEEYDRERAGGRREMSGAGIRADEEVGPFQEGSGVGNRHGAGPVAEPVMRLEGGRERQVVDSADDDNPPPGLKKRLEGAFQGRRGHRLAAVPAPRCTASRGGSAENRSAWSQSARSIIDPAARGGGLVSRPSHWWTPRTAAAWTSIRRALRRCHASARRRAIAIR